MSIKKIKLTHLRNIQAADLELSDGFNMFYGENGSGKTSVLEAAHLLSLRKSFRTHLSAQIIQNNQKSFTIFSELTNKSQIGVEKKQSEPIVVKKNGNLGVSTAEIASLLPLQLIHTEGFQLLDAGPKLRRQFMDWGLFHVEHDFYEIWQKFNSALSNRNAILKQGGSRDYLEAWDKVLIENACLIDKHRQNYLTSFQDVFLETIDGMLDIQIGIKYNRGWDQNREYADILAENLAKDRFSGYTQFGPHRADIKVTAYHQPVHMRLSRGQLKLTMCALRLAQGQHLFLKTGKKCLYLVDDVAAELDRNYLSNLVEKLNFIQAQVLVTGIEKEHLQPFMKYNNSKVFHVKHGSFALKKQR